MGVTDGLYRAARFSATLRAASRGPGPLARRVVRRRIYRVEYRWTRRLLRLIGL